MMLRSENDKFDRLLHHVSGATELGAGFRRPKCENKKGWRRADERGSRSVCPRKVSVTVDTIFDRSHVSLKD
jgi:hypothetical protein